MWCRQIFALPNVMQDGKSVEIVWKKLQLFIDFICYHHQPINVLTAETHLEFVSFSKKKNRKTSHKTLITEQYDLGGGL
jgi:hypothetical protein